MSRIFTVSLALTFCATLLATELQDRAAITTAVTNCDVETVQKHIPAFNTPEERQDLLAHAQAIQTILRVKYANELKTSRIWAGIKALGQAYFVLLISDYLSFRYYRYDSQFDEKKNIISFLYNCVYILQTYPEHIIASVLESLWAYQNATFAYHGASKTAYQLAKIEKIISIIKTAHTGDNLI